LNTLRRGVYTASILIAIGGFFVVKHLIPEQIGIYFCILAGLIAGNLIGFSTEYYTSATYKPCKKLSDSTKTGPATLIIDGLSLGMMSTAAPVVIVGITVMFSFMIGGGADFLLDGDTSKITAGLFGIAIAAVGMLSTLGITLATDAYGPIADNAGGIASMSELPPEVRERTDALDTLGNTTAATGKGFAIGSAALTSLALIAAFKEKVVLIVQELQSKGSAINFEFNIELLNPSVLIGMFLGVAVVFVFSSMTMTAVARAAASVVVEVRRQFNEIVGLREGTPGVKPESEKCIDICTRSALRELVMPIVIVVLAPIIVGFLLGPNGVAGMLAGATMTGFSLALMMSNSGGAWDNAKKYIEAGNAGGKGSENHKVAVMGDTVGDPLKDTAGPSLNTVIKLLSVVAIVFATLILEISIAFPWN
jgi:K(+)-stimulated pyrophosphate-energized sodium pump